MSLELFSINAKDRRTNWLSDDIGVEEFLAAVFAMTLKMCFFSKPLVWF